MRRVIVKNYDTNEVLYEYTSKKKDFSDAIRELKDIQEEKNFLNVEGTVAHDGFGFGIHKICSRGSYDSSQSLKDSDVIFSPGSFVIGKEAKKEDMIPNYIRVINTDHEIKKTSLRIMISSYRMGYLISCGKKAYNILGSSEDAYFSKITSKNFKSSVRKDARYFDSLKKVLKYLESKKEVFSYMTKEYGYHFNVVPSCDEFVESDHSKDREQVANALFTLLSEINADDEDDSDSFSDLDNDDQENMATEDECRAEILKRAQAFNFYGPVLTKLKDKSLYMSEAGGILYDLDENAKKAVKAVEEIGDYPYHVIHNVFRDIGDVYTVLYVSKEKNHWRMEFNRKSEPVDAWCYTEAYGLEHGSVGVTPANGGLVRTM